MKIIETPYGMTVRQLKDWLAQFPDTDPDTGEDRKVFVDTGPGTTGPVLSAWPMNCDGRSGDVGIYSNKWD